MQRPLVLAVLLVGCVVSFGVAVWQAVHGRMPLVETGHAILFALFAFAFAAHREQVDHACGECGRGLDDAFSFCAHCGRVPRAA